MASRNEYAQISKAVYGEQSESALNTDVWTHIDLNGNPTSDYIDDRITIDSGFQGGLYGKDANHDGIYEEIVVAYRGTEFSNGYLGGLSNNIDMKDIVLNDISVGFNIVPAQYQSALKLYNDAVKKFGSDKVTITGHSLGGILTQLVCAKTGAQGVTFNSAGTKNLLTQIKVDSNGHFSNITNYTIENDFLNFINVSLGLNNIGNNYIIPNTNEDPFTAHSNFNALADATAVSELHLKQNYQFTINPVKTKAKFNELTYDLPYIDGQLSDNNSRITVNTPVNNFLGKQQTIQKSNNPTSHYQNTLNSNNRIVGFRYPIFRV